MPNATPIAANFLLGYQAGQTTLVVSPGNDERRELNRTIRELLVATGQVSGQGQDHSILVAKDLTKAEMKFARNYSEGDVIHFSRADKRQGIAAGAHLSVESINRQANTLTLRGPGRARIRSITGAVERRPSLSMGRPHAGGGDRLQFRIHDRANHIANGEFATITELDDRPRQIALRQSART